MLERGDMRLREIGNVNEIADAGAVRRRVIGAENVHHRALAGRGLDSDFQQMRRALR